MFLFLILELKNTLGPAGDALLRAALDYTKIASQKMLNIRRFGCHGLPLFTVQACPPVL